MSQQGHLNAAALCSSTFQVLNIEEYRERTPIQIEQRQRHENNDERHTLRELPARTFKLPRDYGDKGKRDRQPYSGAACDKQRQRRRSDCGVGSESKIGVEVH